MFKSLSLAVGLSTGLVVAASAGGMSEPVMEQDIVIETVEETSGGAALLPFVAFALLVAVASNN